MGEQILVQLFMSYVRMNDFQSQKSTALQLYKAVPKKPYYGWAVMSTLLQATHEPEKYKLLLTLAERMMEKMIPGDDLKSDELFLYLTILQKLGKYEEALNFIENPATKVVHFMEPIAAKIELLKSLKRWPELNILLKELLKNDFDRWDFYKVYIKSVIEMTKLNVEFEGADFNHVLCDNYLKELIDASKNKSRGPHLGRLQLQRVMIDNGLFVDVSLDSYKDLLANYFVSFGSKPSCSNELSWALELLPAESRADFIKNLEQDFKISLEKLPETKEQMQKHICFLQISRLCETYSMPKAELCKALVIYYEHGRKLFSSNQLPTDFGISDPYILLAAHTMYDMALEQNSMRPLFEALYLLHRLLANSESNFHAKVLCLQIHNILACPMGAQCMYTSLDIKHVMLDSLCHLHCAQLPISGIPSISKLLYTTTLSYFRSALNDGAMHLLKCYKLGSFSKIDEFMKFNERCSTSLNYAAITIEELLNEVITIPVTTTAKSRNSLTATIIAAWHMQRPHYADNRDISVIAGWDPIQLEVERKKHQTKDSFMQAMDLCRIRSILLHLTGLCPEFIAKGNDEARKAVLQCKELWLDAFKDIRNTKHERISNQYLGNPLPSRLHSMLEMPYEQCFSGLCDFVVTSYGDDDSIKGVGEGLQLHLIAVGELCKEKVTEYNKNSETLWGRYYVQETIVNCVEILSIFVFVLVNIVERMPLHSKKSKRKDAIKQTQPQPYSSQTAVQAITGVVSELKRQLHACDVVIDSLKKPQIEFVDSNPCTVNEMSVDEPNAVDDLSTQFADMQLIKRHIAQLKDIFRVNHERMVRELKCIISERLRMIS